MKIWGTYLCICVLVFASTALNVPDNKTKNNATILTTEYFKKEAVGFYQYAKILKKSISQINGNNPAFIIEARVDLKNCRLHYKRISFFLDYFFPSESISFNAAPKYEIEEPFMEYQHPKGLQVIESLLFEKNAASNKSAMMEQAELIEKSAEDLPSLLYDFNCSNNQLLESLQLELIRVMTLYITGYDAPYLKSGIEEAQQSLSAFAVILNSFENYKQDSLVEYLNKAISYLKSGADFNAFNRLEFISGYALPLQERINKFSVKNGWQLNSTVALNESALNLFSANALDKNVFPHEAEMSNRLLIELGKKLFSEKDLSLDRTRSCSSCHSPSAYFTDGLSRNQSLDKKNILPRNTMGLMYACYQYSQFWDGRAKNIEEQIKMVLKNKDEMGCDDSTIVSRIKTKKDYVEDFQKIWTTDNDAVDSKHIISAIASYVRSLAPFNSVFDKYMQGDKSAMTSDQIQGFNLFMGKAQCGTCHFAPIFNGLTPPLYNRTEYEVLGTTVDDNFQKPLLDSDIGRQSFFNISFYNRAFKTPTVRNAAMTAPYMHNGKFKNLETLIEFYNKGGGKGLGLKVQQQTLSSNVLNLSKKEELQVVSFIKALTDEIP